MSRLSNEYAHEDTFLRRWASVIILLILFLSSWGGQFVTQMEVEKQQSKQHGQAFSMEEYWPQFWSSTLENWQSEWLQLVTQALIVAGFASYLFRKGDEEHFKTHLMIDELRQEVAGEKVTDYFPFLYPSGRSERVSSSM
jgi:hypothetical protein